MNKFNWFVVCPIPRDQRPFYEYLKRKESFFLGWVGLNESAYAGRFFISLVSLFLIILPLTNLSVSIVYYPIRFLLLNILVSLIVLIILYGYFFIAWTYVGKRLLAAKVSYEESGWYDGKIWIKPPNILKHERLLYYYQLVPLITRLAKTLRIILLAIIVLSFLLFLLI